MRSTKDPMRLDDNFDGRITISYLSRGFFATFDGYTTPPVIKKWQLKDGKLTWAVWRRTEYTAVDLSNLTVSQVRSPTQSSILCHELVLDIDVYRNCLGLVH
jgi:hypothetical protein